MKPDQNPKTSTVLAQPHNTLAKTAGRGEDVKVTKRSISRMIVGSLGLLVAGQMMVACQPNSGAGSASPADLGTPTPPPPNLGGNGTGDSSGGNGLNNKVFEAYTVDITKTPEWIKHIQPIEDQIASVPEPRGTSLKGLLTSVARSKAWFIAPVDLGIIEKSTLSVEFIKDPIQQIALQTFGENASGQSVWIDAAKYGAANVTDRDRAYTQMHETVVGLYLMRFMPALDICKIFAAEPGNCDPDHVEKHIGQHETFRKLQKADYERIRTATTWIMENASSIKNQTEMLRVLYRLNFDPRFFGRKMMAQQDSEEFDPKKASLEYAVDQVVNAEILDKMPSVCYLQRKRQSPGTCAIAVTSLNFENPRERLLTTKIRIPSANGQPVEYIAQQIISLEQASNLLVVTRPLHPSKKAFFLDAGYAVPVGQNTLSRGQDFYSVRFYFDDRMNISDIEFSNVRATSESVHQSNLDTSNVQGEFVQVKLATPALASNRTFTITNSVVEETEYDRGAFVGQTDLLVNARSK